VIRSLWGEKGTASVELWIGDGFTVSHDECNGWEDVSRQVKAIVRRGALPVLSLPHTSRIWPLLPARQVSICFNPTPPRRFFLRPVTPQNSRHLASSPASKREKASPRFISQSASSKVLEGASQPRVRVVSFLYQHVLSTHPIKRDKQGSTSCRVVV
jgi:hypothetical protein